MFAVKGWAVDANTIKPQTEPFKTNPTSEAGGESRQNSGRKRKRGDRNVPVSNEEVDVGKLWTRHVDKIRPQPAEKLSRRERKRKKIERQSRLENEESERQQGLAESTPEVPKKDKKKKAKGEHDDSSRSHNGHSAPAQPVAPPVPKTTPRDSQPQTATKLTPMQAAMRQKLISARFRHLNETLYTAPSNKALKMFGENPEMFEDYHSGFRQQVSVWPENPVDKFIAAVRERGKAKLPSQKKAFKGKKGHDKSDAVEVANLERISPLPRTDGACVLADLGCGDARLAQTFKDSGDARKFNLKVLSYDLHSPSPLVTKADVSNLPAADGSVNVAIFCLALMGTNWISFIEEAYRILHWKGELWVAEIKSRFGRVSRAGKPVEHSVGGKRKLVALKKANEAKRREEEEINEQETLEAQVDGVETKPEETDVTSFVNVLKRRGFILKNDESSIDLSNKMFVKMEFIKAATPTKGKGVPPAPAREPVKAKPKKFLDDATEDPATEDEAKVLKPSLYKIR